MSDVIADLRRDLELRLKDIERELEGHEPLLRERDRLQAGAGPAAVRDGRARRGRRGSGARRRARGRRAAPTARRSSRSSASGPE